MHGPDERDLAKAASGQLCGLLDGWPSCDQTTSLSKQQFVYWICLRKFQIAHTALIAKEIPG